jgi:FtsP/CotA-like multicopper oxidase with cupredoxin domain
LGQGLSFDPGQRFEVNLRNDLPEPTIIHWHGQIPPNRQDGVPDMPMPPLNTGETRSYDYELMPGTYWMHAHIPMHEMRLLAAPLIVRSADDIAADRQEAVMFLHDFSFKPPQEVMEEIAGGHGETAAPQSGATPQSGMNHAMTGGMKMDPGMMGQAGMPGMDGMPDMSKMAAMAMDLNDYDWDAYLANDRTLSDPEVVAVDKGGRVRLRIINASAATVFWIDTGALPARLVAVDGQGIEPIAGTRFGIAMAQRLDLDLDLAGAGAWPILALREGAKERTGVILATPGAAVTRIAEMSEADHPAFSGDLAQEGALRAVTPLPERAPASQPMLMLGGTMMPYVWTINGQTWGSHVPVTAKSGDRVEIMFHNMSMMAHPMHLHGHAFQVVGIGMDRIAGAVRDTVHVPPMGMVTVAVDAGEAARWMLHCHHMPHLSTGMMTEVAVSA